MEKTQTEKRSEIVSYTISEIHRIITGFMPGSHVIDSFWNYWGGLKQQRLLDFAESLRTVFESELGKDLENYNFETEDFVDVFDSVINKVLITKSEYKLDIFKSILVNSVKAKSDLAQTYIDLTNNLNEIQIKILDTLNSNEGERRKLLKLVKETINSADAAVTYAQHLRHLAETGKISTEQSILKADRDVTSKKMSLIMHIDENDSIVKRTKSHFNIKDAEYDFYFQDLISKSLLKKHQDNIPIDKTIDDKVITYIEVTEFTKDYLNFIKI